MSQSSGCNPELVSAFLDSELDRIIVGHVARHLIGCDHCCRTMGRMAQLRELMCGEEEMPWFESDAFTESVMLAIRNEKSTTPRDRQRDSVRDRLLRFGIPLLVVGTILAEGLPAGADSLDSLELPELHG
ncbi:MAG: hypothetical protein H7834_12360 [Magnetococcus sp. YQC-9]